jgi:hypothetical protein
MKSNSTPIIGKTDGANSTEHNVTWKTMIASLVVIACQVVGKLWLGVDLGVDIDLALSLGFGSGIAYTIGRSALKMGIAYAEGKTRGKGAEFPPDENDPVPIERAPLIGAGSGLPSIPPTRPLGFSSSPRDDASLTHTNKWP